MKIGIITYAFHTSTMPLAKYLSELGNKVDLFCLIGSRSSAHFTIDLTNYNGSGGFIPDSELDGIISKGILDYLENLNDFKIFLYSKRRRYLYINYFLQILHLARFLNSRKYDIIHFIGQNEMYIHLHRLLKAPKVFTFHEIIDSSERNDSHPFELVDFISGKKNSVILHSENIYEKYHETFKPVNKSISVIKFGLFETYRLFTDMTPEEPRTLLYYGIIQPYKGIEYLVEAYKLVKKGITDLKLIIAGRGEFYFDVHILKDDGIEIINRTVSEEELVNLNKRAALVICPYTSSSQSGIPVTSFIFRKPIIASNVPGISEYIIDGYNGILVPPCDSINLAKEIDRLLTDNNLRNTIINNISRMNSVSQETWTSIANQTLQVYSNELQDSISS